MISFSLICKNNHEFEGWFRTSEDYELQLKKNLISCPNCNNTVIQKALMAPAVKSSKKSNDNLIDKKIKNSINLDNKAVIGDNDLRMALRSIRAYVEKNCENVGDNFANEARLISKGKKKARGIYGKVNNKEAEKLLDEGIEINAVPWIKDDA
tara:strand:+ start:244 stop:702 length:459 start_codon:yes stop_codon:yes gene_type:complete